MQEQISRKQSLLMIYGSIELHRDGSEWSAQGLGNTVSSLVEAGWRGRRRVLFMEERVASTYEEVHIAMEEQGEEAVPQNERSARRDPTLEVWNEKVPMLNGNMRRAGLDSKDGAWSGRTVEVGKILNRWFKFIEFDWGAHD